MRAWVMSDLHADSATFELPETPSDIDAIIVAGDVADGHHKSARWLRQHVVPRGLPVIYVPGNHDFYGHDLEHRYAGMYLDVGVELLHPGRPTLEIGGVRFIGCTLWTDYAIACDVDAARAWARLGMPDLQSIDLGLRRIGTRDLLSAHRLQRLIIETELAQPFAGPTVVVTHHAPHPLSLRDPMKPNASDGSFVSDLAGMIEEFQPSLWVHGHVHHSRDYRVENTRVVCNPRGYGTIMRQGAKFDPMLVVEI